MSWEKLVSLTAKRQAAVYLEQTYHVSERRACRLMALHRSTKRRQSGTQDQTELIHRIHTLSEQYPRFGYRKSYHLLQAEPWGVNRETVRRVRQHAGLQVSKKAQ